jgi:hypothetical protein
MNLAEENIGDADEIVNSQLIEILKTLWKINFEQSYKNK